MPNMNGGKINAQLEMVHLNTYAVQLLKRVLGAINLLQKMGNVIFIINLCEYKLIFINMV